MIGFSKDILLIDFETTGLDLDKALPIQLGAVLLDKESLEEKNHFLSFIKQDVSEMSEESAKIHGITQDMLSFAPEPAEVIKDFLNTFGADVYLSSWNEMLDHTMLKKMLESVGKDIYEHDYHYLDIWSLVYMHLVREGRGDIIKSEPTFRYFGLPARKTHDALEDCRHTAEVLRKVYNDK
jgi:DNA polymerase III epsilon subunit-like protein